MTVEYAGRKVVPQGVVLYSRPFGQFAGQLFGGSHDCSMLGSEITYAVGRGFDE